MKRTRYTAPQAVVICFQEEFLCNGLLADSLNDAEEASEGEATTQQANSSDLWNDL